MTLEHNPMTDEQIRQVIHDEALRRHGISGDEFARRCREDEFDISGDIRGLVDLLEALKQIPDRVTTTTVRR